MKKILSELRNTSTSLSDDLLKNCSGNIKYKDLITKPYIIIKLEIGFSYLNDKNKESFFDIIFKGEIKHSAIYLKVRDKDSETGVVVQYGKYEYINREKIKGELKNNVENIGFIYNEKGGLMVATIDYKIFKNIFCTAGSIRTKIDKDETMSLKDFLTRVKIFNGPWDLQSYDPKKKAVKNLWFLPWGLLNLHILLMMIKMMI